DGHGQGSGQFPARAVRSSAGCVRTEPVGRTHRGGAVMLDAPTVTLLRDIIRRESRSLLQYTTESFPWATMEERKALDTIRDLAAEDRSATARLVQYLARQHLTPPHLDPYPMSFTNINYLSLDHVLPQLLDAERQAADQLRRDQARIKDNG